MLLSLSACDLTAVLGSGETVEMNYDYEQMEENLRKMREEDGVYIEMSIVNLETGETPTAEKLVYAQTPNAFYYCGDTGEEGPSGTKKPDPSPDPGGTTKPSQGTQIPLPQGWNENNYGAYIYEVWDSQFLPDCFLEPPAGIAVEQTVFKNYNHDRINQKYAVGPLFYENKEDYREYGVGFYGDLEHLQAFVAAVEAKGMTGGQTEDGD